MKNPSPQIRILGILSHKGEILFAETNLGNKTKMQTRARVTIFVFKHSARLKAKQKQFSQFHDCPKI